jgi:Zn-dependent peptidase ImmA (M78 family)
MGYTTLLHLEKKADDCRQRWGYGTDKPINLQSLLLELNVPTFFKPMEKISGMAFKSDINARFMLVNSAQTVGRQNFTICHELYHLFVQTDFSHKVCMAQSFDKKDPEEYAADNFAAFLLLPTKGIRDLMPEKEFALDTITLDTVVKMEQAFQCSRTALLYRLKQLKHISQTKYIELDKNKIKSAMNRGYPIQLYKPNNIELVWGNYGELAFDLFESGKISEGDYASIMLDIGTDIFEESMADYVDF